ncbi:MAG: hypothetical protein ACK5Y6_02200 [Pseudomonadota bacterium]
MLKINVDTHAHLYDSYNLKDWYQAALRNLNVGSETQGAVIVVDRAGQDTFLRCREEVASFAEWFEHQSGAASLHGVISSALGELVIVRGVQYVTAERLEVLGLGVARALADGGDALSYIEQIRSAGGVPCLPWSPGKWLGKRGSTVRGIIDSESAAGYDRVPVVFGDIAIRPRCFLPSSLLCRARRKGHKIIYGSDALPPAQECGLVGSYGISLEVGSSEIRSGDLVPAILSKLTDKLQSQVWGTSNRPWQALKRMKPSVSRPSGRQP